MTLTDLLSKTVKRFLKEREDPSNLRITDALPLWGTTQYFRRITTYLATSGENRLSSFSARNCIRMLVYGKGLARKIATDLVLLRVLQFEIGTVAGYNIYQQ